MTTFRFGMGVLLHLTEDIVISVVPLDLKLVSILEMRVVST